MKPVWAIVKSDGTVIPYWFLSSPDDRARYYRGFVIGPFSADTGDATHVAPMAYVGWPLSIAYFDSSLA